MWQRYALSGLPNMRLVFDTNVIISAVIGRGVPYRLMLACRQHRIPIYTSIELLSELEGVLHRRKFSSQLGKLHLDGDEVIRRFRKSSTLVVVSTSYPRIARDPKDDKVLACACAAHATAIVSGDKDLLILNPHQNIPILRPRETLQRIIFRSGFP